MILGRILGGIGVGFTTFMTKQNVLYRMHTPLGKSKLIVDTLLGIYFMKKQQFRVKVVTEFMYMKSRSLYYCYYCYCC